MKLIVDGVEPKHINIYLFMYHRDSVSSESKVNSNCTVSNCNMYRHCTGINCYAGSSWLLCADWRIDYL